MSEFTPTIGLEVHAELATKSKMFCGCKNDPHGAEPNTNVCPVCMAHPGTLPSVNKEAVRKVLTFGRAINGELTSFSEFDRKNYFYPDIPKAYQISQYQFPFVKGGEICDIQITRVHLEEDTARSQHDQGEGSLVDFNRAGVPLMELVTEPVIHSAQKAGEFARELQLILKTLGVSDANMERGEMRVEANISVSRPGEKLGTLVEVKNLNSFKSVEGAIEYEIKRQTALIKKGGAVVRETRGWDEQKSKTFSQRTKETADDYRYFPDPDIPKIDRGHYQAFSDSLLDENISLLPEEKRLKYQHLGLKSNQIESIISDIELDKIFAQYFEQSQLSKDHFVTIANYLTSDIVGLMESNSTVLLQDFHADSFLSLVDLVVSKKITSRVAKDLLFEASFEGTDPNQMAEKRGLLQNNSEEDLMVVVDMIIKKNPGPVEEYKSGKESVLQFLVGQGMKATRGSANPALLAELFKKRFD